MKQEKREYGYRSNAYIDGNTVRKEEIVPERTRRVYKDGKRVYESERQIRERERALHMNGSYVFFSGSALISVSITKKVRNGDITFMSLCSGPSCIR